MGDHNGLYLGTVGLFQAGDVDLVGRQRHVEKYGHEAVLKDWIDRGGESCGDSNYLIAGFETPVTKFWRGQRTEGDEVGGGAGVDERRRSYTDEPSQLSLEVLGETTGGKPAIERRVDDGADIFRADDFAGYRDGRSPRDKLSLGEGLCMIFGC